MKYIKLDESDNIEYKSDMVGDLEKFIISFLNSKGGTIYIGVGNNGEVIGINDQKTRDDYELKVTNILSDVIKPSCKLEVDSKFDENNVLVIKIAEGRKKPYYVSRRGPRPSGVYLRVGPSSRPATEDEIQSLILETRKTSYERYIPKEQNLNFMYAERLAQKKGIEFNERSFYSFGIKNTNGLFTNLGLLISDENQVIVKMAVYDKNRNFKLKKEFEGSIMSITDQVIEYANMMNRTTAVILPNQAQRVERKSFPGASLREAIMNSICHANYDKPSNIKIEFYPDRVEIMSPGGLFDGDLEDVLKGYQTYRNVGLVRVFSKFDYIENYGTGLKRIMDAYKNENRQPQFDVSINHFTVILPDLNYVPDADYDRLETIVALENNKKLSNLNTTQIRILELIKENNKITYAELAEITGKTITTIKTSIKILKSKEIIERVGSNKTGYWKVNL